MTSIDRYPSPLRWAGGKTFAIKQITQYFPPNLTEMASPFLGGGSIELTLAKQGVKVWAYDLDADLINFWQQTTMFPELVADCVEERFYPLDWQYGLGNRKSNEVLILSKDREESENEYGKSKETGGNLQRIARN